MKDMTPFQLVLLGIFAGGIVLGIAIFALSKGTTNQLYNLVIWGTMPNAHFEAIYKNSALRSSKSIQLQYVKKDQATFDAEFVEALADGVGPDIVILRDDLVYKYRNKIYTIPFQSYSERSFKDQFIEGSEIFLTKEGIVALPLMVDPMVMYWNRDMFSNNLLAQPPQYWDEMYALVEKMTRRDNSANILQSTIALGEWTNITHAKEVLSMLLLQAGTPITSRVEYGVVSLLNNQLNYAAAPGQSAVNFYTQFANPTAPSYSWNRSLPSSANFFLSGNLAMYLGFASEIFGIQQKNPNLNFDVTYVPQIRDAEKKTVFSHFYAASIVKQSKQIGAAFTAMVAFVEPAPIQALESFTNLPPVRRDLLSAKPTDAYRFIFYNSALLSRSWIDPDPAKSSAIFRDMIEGVTSGRARLSEALSTADAELNNALR